MMQHPALCPGRLSRILVLLCTLSFGLTAAAVIATGAAPLNDAGTPVSGDGVVITAPPREDAAQPTGKQVLRLPGLVDDPVSLDPALARDQNSAFLTRQIFRGLTRLDASLDPVPELAERIEISSDGRRYTFRLRSGLTFHDGSPLTAGDVVASFSRALRPATADGNLDLLGGASYLGDIIGAGDLLAGRRDDLTGARVLDERTVELRLDEPSATFLMKLAGAPAVIVDAEDVARGDDWWRSPNGSGPFQLASWEPGESLTLTRFADYVPGAPLLRRVEVLIGPAAAQPFNLYQADRVDLSGVPSSAIERVSDPAGPLAGELIVTPILSTHFLAFRDDIAPLDDPHVRRAMQLAFPRDKLVEVGYGGHKLTAKGVVPPEILGRDWASDALRYDPEAARRELAASSYGAAEAVLPIRVYAANGVGAEVLRAVLADELGLEVEVVTVDWPAYVDGLTQGTYPVFELSWTADYPDPASFLWSLFGSESPDNYLGYQRDEVDQLLDEAAATLDAERRAELYARVQQLVLEDAVVLPLYHDVQYTLVKPYVRGVEITPLGITRLETIWLERG